MSDLAAELAGFVGLEAEPPIVARDPVNEAMIRAWCDAVGDANPIYTDAEAASRSCHGQIVAPPTMIQAWFFPAVGVDRFTTETTIGRMVNRLAEAGYGSVVATNVEQEYVRYCHVGERLTLHSTVSAVSELKETGLGEGYFVDTAYIVSSDAGDDVCRMSYRRLYFKARNS